MQRILVTVAVNDYRPEVCELTFPNLKKYADRIGAEFVVISERLFPEWHPVYEKLQAYWMAKHCDQLLLVDADLILHPKLPDLLTPMNPDQCGSWQEYPIKGPELTLWPTEDDQYFQRDGRNLGIVGSLVACSKNTRDIFKPLPAHHSPDQVQNRLYRPAIVDEYVMSRNVAKYGLKHAALWPAYHGIHHAEVTTINPSDAVEQLHTVLKAWNQ